MGRQIEYYMELDAYKSLVKKAFDIGFKVVVKEQNNYRIYNNFETIAVFQHGISFYLEEAGPLLIKENGFMDNIRSPLVESGFSYIHETNKEISKSRLWVPTGYWNNEEEFVHRNELLDKKYTTLIRYVKQLAPYTEVEIKAQNPMYKGGKFKSKVYITPFLLSKITSGEYDCI